MKTDTIFGGQWGNPPKYKIKKIKNKEVLITEFDNGYSYGNTVKDFKILSLDKDNFLDEIFKKEILLYKETHSAENNIPTNFLYKKRQSGFAVLYRLYNHCYTYKAGILMNRDEFWQIIQLFASRTKGGEL